MLLFPSTCEGCSSAVMEALSTGLPVIASPNSGTVIRDGTDGFVRAYDQIEAMAEAVEKLASDPALRLEMGRAASQRAGEFSLDWYGRALGRVLTDLLAARPTVQRATA
jgi:glycosyltransferase involved in cell wall biosynthesis